MKKAFHKLAKKYHPDIYKSGPNKEHFKKVLEAYQVLKNPIKREEYDHKIKVKNMKSNEKKGSDFSHDDYE